MSEQQDPDKLADGFRYALTNASRPSARKTDTDQIIEHFIETVEGLPGVIRAERSGVSTMDDHPIRVYVQRGDLNARFQVYDLETETLACYPGARLGVLVLEEGNPPARRAGPPTAR